MTDHELVIRSDRKTLGGHRLTYRCSSCSAAGDMTLPTRDRALLLFGLLQAKHRELQSENRPGWRRD